MGVGLILGLGVKATFAPAAERIEEATVLGKDRSKQAGQVPTDTRPVQVESKMKKEATPAGLKSEAPGVRAPEKMEKPKMADPEREKPEGKRGFGSAWMILLLLIAVAAAAG